MRRRLLIALALALAGAAVWVALWRPFDVTGSPPDDAFVRLGGVVHVHTTDSDGAGTPEEVIEAARRAGLGFLILTDHNNLDAKRVEGYHGGLLVLVGTEVSTTAGHVLGLGIADPVFRFSGDGEDALDDIQALGGVAFAAHPSSAREDFRWTGWGFPGGWGIEVLNGDSQWREAGWGRLLKTALLYGLNRRYALLGSLTVPTPTLAHWDTLLQRRYVPGIVGADAHGRVPLTARRSVSFPSYESIFAIAQNHVLLDHPLSGDAKADAIAVVSALGRGRSYVGLDGLAPAGGFFFLAQGSADRFTMGDTVSADPGLRFRAGGRLPSGARLTLLRNGAAVSEGAGSLDAPFAGQGSYRVEVHLPGWAVPWILSNPIDVFSEAEAAVRRRRAEWPLPSPAPESVAPLDPAPGTTFAAEFDPSSWMTREVEAPHAGPAGGSALLLQFRLGIPTVARPYVSCALVSRQKRDLSGRRGLVFSVRGDGTYRLWLQVRDENPASPDEGTEWWFASVRTSPEWRRVAVPFDRLRSVNPKTDGRLDLDKVRMVAFILDQGAVKVGTEGRIWIGDLGVF